MKLLSLMTLTIGLFTGCSWGPCGPHVITREEYREHREAKRRDAEIKKKSPTEKPAVETEPLQTESPSGAK